MYELLFCLVVIILGCIFLLREGKRAPTRMKKKTSQFYFVAEILNMTKTNNSYPPLLEVLSSLQSNLERNGITLHADLKGYMNNEKTQK